MFEKQNGFKHPDQEEFEKIKLPEGMELVWGYFIQLHNARTSSGFGSNPISYSEIQAWNNLTDSGVTTMDVKIIKRLDIVYLNHQAEKQKRDKK